jgi:hypothetical protein
VIQPYNEEGCGTMMNPHNHFPYYVKEGNKKMIGPVKDSFDYSDYRYGTLIQPAAPSPMIEEEGKGRSPARGVFGGCFKKQGKNKGKNIRLM